MDAASELLKLAQEKFGKLTAAEKKLFRAAAKGDIADYSPRGNKPIDPANAAKWGPSRVLRADRIAWLCTDRQASQFVTHRGIKMRAARIDEKFNIEAAKVEFPFWCEKCRFTADIVVEAAQIPELVMSSTHTGPISADGLKVERCVFLDDGFKAEGEVRLFGATIGRDFNCSSSQFINKQGEALFADGLKVGGDVLFNDDFKAEGGIRLSGAILGGNLDCSNGQFSSKGGKALNADGLKVGGSVFLSEVRAKGEVWLLNATISRSLECQKAQFINKDGYALKGDGLEVDGNVFLSDGLKAEGEVSLIGATVGGNIECDKSKFTNKDGDALNGEGLRVAGSVFLRDGLKAEGEVRLIGAMVGGDLDCEKGQFINKDGYALNGDGLEVAGGIFLRNDVEANGEISLSGATVSGNLECDRSKFSSKDGDALNGEGLRVAGSVFLRDGFKAEGEVRLLRATIGGSLECDKSKFTNKDAKAVNCDGLNVEGDIFFRDGFKAEGAVVLVGAAIQGYFCLTEGDSPEEMTLDLRSARIGTLRDDQESWAGPGRLSLHGLEYDEISDESPRDSKTRIDWLRLQDGFSPQPYEQLAKVLRESGDNAGARDVLVAKNKDKADRTELTRAEWFWYHLFGPLIGYGHKPWLALPLALMIVLSGWVFFTEGYSYGLVTPLSESAYTMDNAGTRRVSEEYPVFNSFVYSIDVFVPVVDLHQVKYWLPNANRGSELVPTGSAALCTGGLLLLWLWIETALGWILTTLFLVGITGLVRT